MYRYFVSLSILFCIVSTTFAQVDHPQIELVQKALQKNNVAVDQVYITDHYASGGITHIYFKQAIDGIPVYNSRGAMHFMNIDQPIVKTSFTRLPKTIAVSKTPDLSALQALERLIEQKELDPSGELLVTIPSRGKEKLQTLRAPKVSLSEIKSGLEYYLTDKGELRLIWTLPIEHVENAWYTNYLVDAHSGDILKEVQWTVECAHGHEGCEHLIPHPNSDKLGESKVSTIIAPNSYEVFAWPVESPNFGSRTMETAPWNDNATASPNGWHTIGSNSYTTTRGNNTDTYLDDNNSNSPTGGDAARADGGANLDFSFPLDVNQDPSGFKDASVTNTFYWTNLMHDVWFNYGFDEASGNFQEENYTANGLGSDYVRSEAQDGGGNCNANFATPPDGGNPRMQMYLCDNINPERDGALDNGVIAHEYGHGISNRLTGGPAASGCLSNQEQMGEGWSDYFGIVMTIEGGDSGADSRGMGTWLWGQGPNGAGIRPYPYSTDFAINPMTYNTIKTVSVPHGVGSVWSTMLWDMTWDLIDEYGFDPDIYNGTGGNNIAMHLVMEGLKLQPCSPGFVDGRDAILEADQLLYGGANQCLIWNAFAKRGLGYSASQGSSGSRSDGIEAFDLPTSCSLEIRKSTATTSAVENDQITYEIIVENNFIDTNLTNILVTDTIPQDLLFVSATNGGTESAGVVSFPLMDLMIGESDTFEVVLEVKAGLSYVVSDFYDDIENGTSNWTHSSSGSTSWATQSSVFNSGATAWFAPDNNSVGTAYLDLAFAVGLGNEAELSFFHQYDTEAQWDGGQVFISIDEGGKWTDLGSKMTSNGYNSIIFNSIPGFSGNSNGFVNTIIDLADYSDQNVIIRFQMNCDQAVGGNGWWIDDIALTNLKLLSINKSTASTGIFKDITYANAVEIIPPSSAFQVTLTKSNILCNGETNGEISTTPQGGSGSYTYSWNDGETTQNRTNLDEGVYRVTISDGIENILKVGIIADPLELAVNLEVEDATNASADNGSIEANASGGTGAYSYLWSNGATTSQISDLVAGVYTVTVSDQNNCEVIDSAEVKSFTCGDDLYDSGGSSSDYSNLEDITTIICPNEPENGVVLTFNSLDIESTWDALYIYNGDSNTAPIFDSGNPETQAGFPPGGFYGSTAPGPFVATNETGCITLRFRSDQFVTGDGWDIDITCTPCAPEVFQTGAEGYGSLESLIECADPVDVISIGAAIFGDTIMLDAPLMIDKELDIDPGMGNDFTIQSNTNGPIFTIMGIGNLDLSRMNLLSGQQDPGGAIINNGILTLDNVNIYENSGTPNPNGLIQNNGQLTVRGDSNIKKD